MATAFVLGNGVSRKQVDLTTLKSFGKIYGCNALYRDFVPDVLVATDTPIATTIQNSDYAKTHVFYTRRPIDGSGALKVPKSYYGYSSGPIAVALASIDQHHRVYLLGFDMGPTQSDKFNNIYAGTEFYKPVNSQPTFTGNWVKQLTQITKDHPNTEFVRVCGTTTARISELESIKNLVHLDLGTFLDRLNNKKDL